MSKYNMIQKLFVKSNIVDISHLDKDQIEDFNEIKDFEQFMEDISEYIEDTCIFNSFKEAMEYLQENDISLTKVMKLLSTDPDTALQYYDSTTLAFILKLDTLLNEIKKLKKEISEILKGDEIDTKTIIEELNEENKRLKEQLKLYKNS